MFKVSSVPAETKKTISGKRTTRNKSNEKLDVVSKFTSEPKTKMKIVDELAQKQLIMKTQRLQLKQNKPTSPKSGCSNQLTSNKLGGRKQSQNPITKLSSSKN